MESRPGPLDGLKVLDVGQLIAAPMATALLGDFGAEVIKVELPGVGDPLRQLAPFHRGTSLWWKVAARNKKSITLDLRKPKGQKLLLELVRKVDVVAENFRPGIMESWNLGYENLKKVNPQVICLRISGYGQTGPYRYKYGFGRMAEAMSGMTFLIGYPDRAPLHAGFPIADCIAGILGAASVMIALYHRDAKGNRVGQCIDLALYEAVFKLIEFLVAEYDQLGTVRERQGNRNPYVAPVNTYETRDGKWASVTASTQNVFERLMVAIGREDLISDPRFASNAVRVQHADELDHLLAEWIGQRTLEEVRQIFDAGEVPFSPIYSVADIVADPHYQAREAIIEVLDNELGSLRMQGVVPKFSLTPGRIYRAGPSLGEHNRQVYQHYLGLSDEELQELAREGVI